MALYTWDEILLSGITYQRLRVTSLPLDGGYRERIIPWHTLYQLDDPFAVKATTGALQPLNAVIDRRVRVSSLVTDSGAATASEPFPHRITAISTPAVPITPTGNDLVLDRFFVRIDDKLQNSGGPPNSFGFAPEVTGTALAKLRDFTYGGASLPWAITLGAAFSRAFICPQAPAAHPGRIAPFFRWIGRGASRPYEPVAPVGVSCYGPKGRRIRRLSPSYTATEAPFFSWYFEAGQPLRVIVAGHNAVTGYVPWYGLPPLVEYYLDMKITVNTGNPAPPVTLGLLLRQWVMREPTDGLFDIVDTTLVADETLTPTGSTSNTYSFGYIRSTASVGTMSPRCIAFAYVPVLKTPGTSQINITGGASRWHRAPPATPSQNLRAMDVASSGGEDELANVALGLVLDINPVPALP